MDVVEILIAAKAEIEKQGWRQGPRYTPGALEHENGEARRRREGCCASDAFIDARLRHNAWTEDASVKALDVLRNALDTMLKENGCEEVFDLIGWNDVPGRTAREVFMLYDNAILMARRTRSPWLSDETIVPPYPFLRCPRCKAVFSDHGIHVCAAVGVVALNNSQETS